MPAIETEFKGYRFRSRVEARWAVFFDYLGIKFDYEPEGFEWPGVGRYLPDFYLPNVSCRARKPGVYIEVKSSDYKLTKYDYDRLDQLSIETEKPVIVGFGLPPVGNYHEVTYSQECCYEGFLDDAGKPCVSWDDPMLFISCYRCGRMRFEHSTGSKLICHSCPPQSVYRDGSPKAQRADSDAANLVSALLIARGERFGT